MFSINPTESLAMAYWATGNLLQNQLFIGGQGRGGEDHGSLFLPARL